MTSESSDQTKAEVYRSGYVALLGKPNVGKSTLLNALLGRKISIVTRKAQTTRHRVLGIVSGPSSQIIFLDTPGVVRPRYKLHESMMREVSRAVTDADIVVFMAEATAEEVDTLSLEQACGRPAILAINKIDLVRQQRVLPLVERYMDRYAFEAVVPISAMAGQNIEVLRKEIESRMPAGPQYYSNEVISEYPERFFVAEIIREKIFERFRDEIPYATTVCISRFEERDGAKDYIAAEIVVERPTQKGIIIGSGGRALKSAGVAARMDVEKFLERPVYLELFVKVRADWRNREVLLRSYGY